VKVRLWRLWARMLPRDYWPYLLPYWRYVAGFCEAWLASEAYERAALATSAFANPRSRYCKGIRCAGTFRYAFQLVMRERDPDNPLTPEEWERFARSPECMEPGIVDVAGTALGVCSAIYHNPGVEG